MVYEKGRRESRTSWTVFHAQYIAPMRCVHERKQEGQHPLTGQRAANFRRDLEATSDFN